MKFDTYFRISSYAMIACGALALVASGGMSVWLAFVFTLALVVSWALEGRGRQLSERKGLLVVLLSLPLFYLDWKIWNPDLVALEGGHAGLSALVHLTLFLSAVKLFQVKADRDWLFLYLISFFEVLLAAGLSIGPVFLAVLGLYMFCALLSIICFELRKARRIVPDVESRLLVEHDAGSRWRQRRTRHRRTRELRRLPVAA
ncbi:MAG: transglutaminaseTgpA domain-containing protein, partial [Pyrinomonadaceae bacterium]